MKKFFKKATAWLLTIVIMSMFIVVGYAKNDAELLSTAISAQAGENITVPVSIKNNPGIMGYKIIVSFDNKVFYPVKVTRGKAVSGGMFDNNIGNNISNEIFVLWSSTSNRTENGLLFSVEFKTDANVKGKHTIKVSVSPDDTFNENWQNVDIKGTVITVDFGGEDVTPNFFNRVLEIFKTIWIFIKNIFK